MKLYLAEKKRLGRAIAAAEPTLHKKRCRYIGVGGNDDANGSTGHLLKQEKTSPFDKFISTTTLSLTMFDNVIFSSNSSNRFIPHEIIYCRKA